VIADRLRFGTGVASPVSPSQVERRPLVTKLYEKVVRRRDVELLLGR
jgi:hypothetical protein